MAYSIQKTFLRPSTILLFRASPNSRLASRTVLPGMPKEYHPYVYLLEEETADAIAEKLGIAKERVALRGEEVMQQIIFEEEIKKDSLLVTPVGICLNSIMSI